MLKTPSTPILLLTMTLVCGLTLSCNKSQSTAVGVLASVNGTPITQEDIDYSLRGAESGHNKELSINKEKILDNLVLRELLYQHALKLGLDADPAYQAELRAREMQINAFKREKLSQLLLHGELNKKVEVTDNEVQQYFNENAARFRTELNVWQVLRRDEKEILKIQADLAQGLPFEKVVGQLFPAELLHAGRKPWDLGYLQWNQIPDAWQNVIVNMKVGETSDIIRGSNNRFWIIKLIDKRENKDLTFEQVKPMIVGVLNAEKARQLREKTIQELRDNARIVYSK